MKHDGTQGCSAANAARPPPGDERPGFAEGQLARRESQTRSTSRTAIVIAHVRSGQAGLHAGPDL